MKSRSAGKKKFYLKPEKILLIKQALFGIFLFSVLALIITGIWYGTRVANLTISDVKVADGETVRGSLVKEKVNEVLMGNYFHLVPRKFAWFYPEAEILRVVREIPRVKEVEVERLSGTELAVTFSEYFPDALWCGKTNEVCYFVDDAGFAFGKAPGLFGESLIRYYRLGEDPQPQVGLIEEKDFASTKEFTRLLAGEGWFVNKVEVDAVRDVFYLMAGGGEIRAFLQSDPTATFSYFQTLIRSKEFAHLKPGNFQYVDLRFGAKVYVNEELEMEEEAVAEIVEVEDEVSE